MIIFLNGTSSAGKTTLVRALQEISPTPLLTIGVDTFISMMPKKYLPGGEKQKEGFFFVQEEGIKEPKLHINNGYFGHKIFDDRSAIVKAFADKQFDIVIDEVLDIENDLDQYANALKNHTVHFIGVYCDLEIMVEREIMRGDRSHGLARGQYGIVHAYNDFYDLTVDTTCASYFQLARHILQFVQETPHPQGFEHFLKNK